MAGLEKIIRFARLGASQQAGASPPSTKAPPQRFLGDSRFAQIANMKARNLDQFVGFLRITFAIA